MYLSYIIYTIRTYLFLGAELFLIIYYNHLKIFYLGTIYKLSITLNY